MSGTMMDQVPLSELLIPVSRVERLAPTTTYTMLGVRWYAEGLFIREAKPGAEIAADRLYRVEPGDFVYNRLFAWKGSFAIATEEHQGCYVSNEFPCFDIREDRIDPRFLSWYFRREAAWNEALGMSTGATPTSRNRLKERDLLSMTIPLPPLDEQRRIVGRIEEVAGRVEEAQRLRAQISSDLHTLARAVLFDSRREAPTLTSMGDLVRLRPQDVAVQPDESYQFAGVYSFGRGVFRGQRRQGSETAYRTLTRVRTGDFVYPKLMAWEGALGVVPPECDGCVVSPEFPVFEIDTSRVLSETLDVYFRNPAIWPTLSGSSSGTNVRRRRLNPTAFLEYEMPLPRMATQHRSRGVILQIKGRERTLADDDALQVLVRAVLETALRGQL